MESDRLMNENCADLTILVVEDVEEIRDGIVQLLEADGYCVEAARDERDAVDCALRKHTDLILISLGGSQRDVITTAREIRARAGLGELVPVVVFCVAEVCEGEELAIGQNVYLTHPDNFNQLRSLLNRLLHENQTPLKVAIV